MYKQCQSYVEQSDCVASLAERAAQLDQGLPYDDYDARRIAFSNMVSVARAGQMMLNLFDSWTRQPGSQVIPQLLGITPATEAAVNSAGEMLAKTSKLALVVNGQFQIENLLRTLSTQLHLPTDQTGFYRIADQLVQRLAFDQTDLATLNVAALIRNSLHRNGIHFGYQGADTITVLDGVRYEFPHEDRVQCAGWEHIAHALESSLDVLERIVEHPEVAALPHPIMDQYSWDVLTTPSEGG